MTAAGGITIPKNFSGIRIAMGTDAPIRIIMAGGGTGGHLYPGLAVAAQLRRRLGDNLQLIWAATGRTIDRRLLSGFGPDYIEQPVRPLSRAPWHWPAFYRAWRRSCAFWRGYYQSHSVHAVLALGGYAAGPAAWVAAQMSIPMGLLNPDARPGRANRFLMHGAGRVFTQWPLPQRVGFFVRPSGKESVVGCPIRADLIGVPRKQAISRLGLDPERRTLVVTGASLGARTINEAMKVLMRDEQFLGALAGRQTDSTGWQVLHLAGSEQAQDLRAAAGQLKKIPWLVLDYCDDMGAVWAAADLALARAGAGTCAELTACGVPAVLLPYPFHKDNHQRANARQLCSGGAAVLARDQVDPKRNAYELKNMILNLLGDESRRRAMALAARSMGKPDAAACVADWLLAQARAGRMGSCR
jgi:UDP-N-acetylglucosamine:LPS N-acetylglucosamine transferase